MRSFSEPNTLATVKRLVALHFCVSWAHVDSATFLGAMSNTF